jgi:hypothetical protein
MVAGAIRRRARMVNLGAIDSPSAQPTTSAESAIGTAADLKRRPKS